jgi:putative glutamine amidotransferase
VSRPIIGLATALEPARWGVWDQEAALLPSNYVERVQMAGGRTLLLPPDPAAVDDPVSLLELIDGLLLAGGADIGPSFYGQDPTPELEATYPDRDRFEISLAKAAIERGQPVLGICRGMQVINVALGGTLHQDIGAIGDERHRASLGDFSGADHEVRLADGSLAAASVGSTLSTTKSHHHQAVDSLGAGLTPSGDSPDDGTCEAIEFDGADFILGVQWHAEATPDDRVIPAFVEASAKWSECRQEEAR